MLDEFLEKRRLEIGIALVGLLMAGAGVWWWRRSAPPEARRWPWARRR